jgi:hypothetical protein
MAFTEDTNDYDIIAALGDQPNANDGLTSDNLKAEFDKVGNAYQTFFNDTFLTEIASAVDGSSGASNIGAYSAAHGATVQAILTAIIAAGTGSIPADGSISDLKLATDVKMGSIAALTGGESNAVAAINAVVADLVTEAAALVTHKSSSDHDGRYFTETELLAGAIDARYYTETEANALLLAKQDKSVMTTAGDIVQATGAGAWERLAIGTAGQTPAVNSGATALEYVTPTNVATGTYGGNDGTDRTISLSFTPKLVLIVASNHIHVGFTTAVLYGFKIINATVSTSSANADRPRMTTNGFIVSGSGADDTNSVSYTYSYTAIG